MVWHHQDADPGFASCRAKEMLDHLESVLSNEPIAVKSDQYIVEVKPQKITQLLIRLLPELILPRNDDFGPALPGPLKLKSNLKWILERRSHLRSLIEEVRRTWAVQRASCRRRGGSDGQGLSTVVVVGYANDGKSTLVNALSDSNVYCDDRVM